MKMFQLAMLLTLSAAAAKAGTPEGLAAGASALSAAPIIKEGTSLPEAGRPAPAGASAAYIEELRAEAAADPDKFIDERTPEEVSLAFGLPFGEDGAGDRQVMSSALAPLAEVRITVDLSAQRLTLESPELNAEFPISSGLPPHGTPGSGRCFKPDSLERMHYSSLYNNAPMPNSIFFNGNIAIHATAAEQLLGQPASHGCIRTSRADSKKIFDAVLAHGRAATSVCVTGRTPAN